MKKYNIILGSLLINLSILTACVQKQEAATVEQMEMLTTETVVTESINTEAIELDDIAEEKQTETVEAAREDIFIEEQILIEENNVKMTATGIEINAAGDGYINLQMENNTDQDLTFIVDSPFMNDCYVGGSYYETVSAGESKNGTFLFLWNEFYELYGAGDPAKIEAYVAVNTFDNSESVANRTWITIPTNKFAEYNGAYDESGEVLYENNGIRIINKGVNEDNTAVIICAENQNYGSLYIQAESIVINGYELSPTFICANSAGQKQIGLVYFKDMNWNDVEVGTATEGEMTLQIYAKENESDANYAVQTSENVTFKF